MTRDNFLSTTKLELAHAANFHCVRPGCGRLVQVFDPDTAKRINVGSASHDSAASTLGPRYNVDLTPEQRRAYSNGAWLCMHCATVVDRLAQHFPPGTLPDWQRKANLILQAVMLQPVPPQMIDLRAACAGAQAFCNRLRAINLNDYGNVPWSTICKIRELARDCYQFWPLNPLSSLYQHTVNLQTRVVGALKAIDYEVTGNTACWWSDNESSTYRLMVPPYSYGGTGQEQEHIQRSAEVVRLFGQDCLDANSSLVDFYMGRANFNTLNWW